MPYSSILLANRLLWITIDDEEGIDKMGAQSIAPVWVPDKLQKTCMLCGDKFTTINRRVSNMQSIFLSLSGTVGLFPSILSNMTTVSP